MMTAHLTWLYCPIKFLIQGSALRFLWSVQSCVLCPVVFTYNDVKNEELLEYEVWPSKILPDDLRNKANTDILSYVTVSYLFS